MQQKLINNNSQLAQAEMKFHIADQILKLELAEQYPDLKFGLSVEDEVGEKKRTVSIPFAIEIPLSRLAGSSLRRNLRKFSEEVSSVILNNLGTPNQISF